MGQPDTRTQSLTHNNAQPMINTKEEARMVTGKARRWRDTLKHAPLLKLSAGERADLMHILDELQHAVDHQLVPQLPSRA